MRLMLQGGRDVPLRLEIEITLFEEMEFSYENRKGQIKEHMIAILIEFLFSKSLQRTHGCFK